MSSISFIVIGRNEGWKLLKCFTSLIDLIEHNKLSCYEIIYVDSNSTDASVNLALSFDKIKAFRITGTYNAAIARNIGAMESSGEVLFFIDGDMEVNKDFLPSAFTEDKGLKYNYCSGHIFDYVYDLNNTLVVSRGHTYKDKLPESPMHDYKNGGIFLIKRELWFQVGGMKPIFRRSQDLDLAIRLYKKGLELIRLPLLIADHHTLDYHGEKSLINQITRGYMLYPALLFRHHFSSIPILKQTLRTNYTALMLLVLIPVAIVLPRYIIWLTGIYLIMNLTRTVMKHKDKPGLQLFLERSLSQIVKDMMFIFSLLFFHPRERKAEYVRCSD